MPPLPSVLQPKTEVRSQVNIPPSRCLQQASGPRQDQTCDSLSPRCLGAFCLSQPLSSQQTVSRVELSGPKPVTHLHQVGDHFFLLKKKKKGHLGNLTLLTLMPSQACHVSSRCWRETVRGKLILINSWVCSWGQRGTEIDFTSCCSGFKDFIKKKEKRKKKKGLHI